MSPLLATGQELSPTTVATALSTLHIQRAVKVSLKWLTKKQRRKLQALLEAYRGAVNFFVRLLWREPRTKWSTETSERLRGTRLSTKQRDQALKQAVEMVRDTKKGARELGVEPSRPVFRGMALLCNENLVHFEENDGAFGKGLDLVVSVAVLESGSPLKIPTKRTKILKKWLKKPGARLVGGCGLTEGDLLTLWVEYPAPAKKTTGKVFAVDVGVTKLLATSEGEFLGKNFREVRDKVLRRKPGSKGKQRARTERDDLYRYWIKRLPWDAIRALGYEGLDGIKTGKKPGRGRKFRRAMGPWRPPLAEKLFVQHCQDEGVADVPAPARRNSTTCPACLYWSPKNRNGEHFLCRKCGYEDDADLVGAYWTKDLTENLLGERLEAWAEECAEAEKKRAGRKLRAKRSQEKGAEKKRQKESNSKTVSDDETVEKTNSSSKGAQRTQDGQARKAQPVRRRSVVPPPTNVLGPPKAEEKLEGGPGAGARREGYGSVGEEPPVIKPGPSRPRGNCQVQVAVGSWPLE
jgi:hypothetical protein